MIDMANNSPQFVFLVGAARSGTKFLRDILSESEAVSSVPFDVNYVWRYRNEKLPDDCIRPECANPNIRSYVETTLTGMARRSNGRITPIVIEKSVSNVFRVPFMFELFPDAKFVHLIRDGRDVALSASRQWENPNDVSYLAKKIQYFPIRNFRYGIWYLRNAISSRLFHSDRIPVWGPRYPGIDKDASELTALEIAAKQWSESVSAACTGFQLIAKAQIFTIRYEELVTDSRHLHDLCDFLSIPDPDRVMDRYRIDVQCDKIGSWRQLPEEQKQTMLNFVETSLHELGYDNDGEAGA